MKKIVAGVLALLIILSCAGAAFAADSLDYTDTEDVDASVFDDTVSASALSEPEISAPSAILLEKETGTIIYEKNADEIYEPASVTKVMTILLIVEAIESGSVSLEDMIPVSAHAASMGGSQVFLEEGESMSLSEMLKCIVVSSANDAAVAVAEYLAGSEDVFVSMMNERAAVLGMENTHFTNCTGLMDDETHVTTARDIAIMSRELIRHDMIKDYTTIWMDTIRNGEFGLSNTNKLIYYYDGATGLKTGFTQRAKYCLAATAMRNGTEYIAVIMHAETSADRFESAKTLLSYAFANYTLISATPDEALPPIPVSLGKADTVQPVLSDNSSLLVLKSDEAGIIKHVELKESLNAPVCAGDTVGTLTIKSGDAVISEVPIVASCDVEDLGLFGVFKKFLAVLFTGKA